MMRALSEYELSLVSGGTNTVEEIIVQANENNPDPDQMWFVGFEDGSWVYAYNDTSIGVGGTTEVEEVTVVAKTDKDSPITLTAQVTLPVLMQNLTLGFSVGENGLTFITGLGAGLPLDWELSTEDNTVTRGEMVQKIQAHALSTIFYTPNDPDGSIARETYSEYFGIEVPQVQQ